MTMRVQEAVSRMQQQPPQPNWFEVERVRATLGRSYTTPAVISMLLYLVFWFPGLIANGFYLLEAIRVERLTGQSPDGIGCLWAVLIAFNLPLLGVLFFIFVIPMLSEMFR